MTKLTYTPKMIVCSCCKKEKPRTDFYTEAYTDQPTKQCKDCINIKRSVERHKQKHSKFVSKEKCRSMEDVSYGLCDWKDAMLHFSGRCCYCGVGEARSRASKFDREHFVPLSRGGSTVRTNIGPACRKCNRGRGNKKLFDWYRSQETWSAEREAKIVEWIGIDNARKESYDE